MTLLVDWPFPHCWMTVGLIIILPVLTLFCVIRPGITIALWTVVVLLLIPRQTLFPYYCIVWKSQYCSVLRCGVFICCDIIVRPIVCDWQRLHFNCVLKPRYSWKYEESVIIIPHSNSGLPRWHCDLIIVLLHSLIDWAACLFYCDGGQLVNYWPLPGTTLLKPATAVDLTHCAFPLFEQASVLNDSLVPVALLFWYYKRARTARACVLCATAAHTCCHYPIVRILRCLSARAAIVFPLTPNARAPIVHCSMPLFRSY